MRARPPMSVRLAVTSALGLLATACFDPGAATKGLPCTEDGPCGSLSCEYGVCGGPVRCEAGAGVGDYCFTFEAREIDVGNGVDTLAVGVIDIDALPDIIAGNGDAQTIAFLRNLGAGEFAGAVHSQPLGLALDEIAIGAVDGAGWADVVATIGGTTLATIPISPGASGTGEIGAPQVVASDLVGAARPQIGHFVDDGDSLPDIAALVTTGFDVFPQLSPSTFDTRKHTEVAGSADLHKAGLDANPVYVASSSGNSVVAHTRVVGGVFAAQTTIVVGPSPSLFVLDDLDNDGNPDVLMQGDAGRLWLTTGRDATFLNPREPDPVYDLGWQATTLVAHNLDDDREPELVLSGTAPNGRRDVYLFDNDGEGKPIYGGSLGIEDASSVVVTDLDLDGAAEIVVASELTGKIRVARRAVAPPPPGGEESTSSESTGGVDPTIASSSPTDPMTGDPTTYPTTDPTTDPSDSDTSDTEPLVCFEWEVQIGMHCYVPIDFLITEPVIDLHVDSFGLQKSLFYLTSTGSIHEMPGIVGSFDQSMEAILFSVPDAPTGLATGMIDLEIDPKAMAELPRQVVVATHASGFTTYTPSLDPAVRDWWVGESSAPLVGRMVQRPAESSLTAIAVSTADGYLQVLEPAELLQNGTPLGVATAAPPTDIDVFFADLTDPALIVSDGGPADLFLKFEGLEPENLGELLPESAATWSVPVLSPAQAGVIATAGPGGLAAFQFVDEVAVPIFYEKVPIVSDLQLGEFDGAPGAEIVAIVDYGDGDRHLRIWNWVEVDFGWTLQTFAVLEAPYATAFTLADLGGLSTDILVANYDDGIGSGPKITQLLAVF